MVRNIVLRNGLIRRTLRLQPNAATVAYDNLMTGASILRGVKPEAMVRSTGDRFNIGGLRGQVEYAYLRPEWVDALTSDPNAFRFVGYETGETKARFRGIAKRYSADLPWPPPGASLRLRFKPPEGVAAGSRGHSLLRDVPGNPAAGQMAGDSQWRRASRSGSTRSPARFWRPSSTNRSSTSRITGSRRTSTSRATMPSTAMTRGRPTRRRTGWRTRNTRRRSTTCASTPALLESRPPLGPDVSIEPGQTFESFRTFELVHDSTERERQGLAVRRMYRTLAPWVTENPILMHVRHADPEAVRLAVDQCAEVGFEMVIMTFGSGLEHGEHRSGVYGQDQGTGRLRPQQGHRAGRLFALGQPPDQRRAGRDQSQDRQDRRRDLRQFALPVQRMGPAVLPQAQDLRASIRASASSSTTARIPAMSAPPRPIRGTAA